MVGFAPEPALQRAWESFPSDEEIVPRVRAGEVALFEVLMRRHNQRVYRAVRSVLRDEQEIEDVMQHAYVAAYAHLSQFTGLAKFSTWLVRIAVNEALARVRRAARFVAIKEGAGEEDPMTVYRSDEPGPEERAFGRELAALVESTVDGLPQSYRTVFMLREVEGMNTAEAAQALAVTEEVVKTRLSRAKAMIRNQLEVHAGRQVARAFPFHAPRCDRVVAAVLERLASRPARVPAEIEGASSPPRVPEL